MGDRKPHQEPLRVIIRGHGWYGFTEKSDR
jgi:hypothetical protein